MLVESQYYDLLKKADELKLEGQHEEAIKLCQEILFDDLSCGEAYEEIGDNYMNLRDYNNAIIALKQALNINPNSGNAHYLLGFSYSAINLWQLSQEHLETANRLEPNHPEILRCLGWTIFHNGNQKQGLIVLQRALNIAPNDTFILSDLGMCYLGSREFQKAQEVFQKLIAIEPHNNKAKECLEACNYFQKRDKK